MLFTLIRVKGQPDKQKSADDREHKKQDNLRSARGQSGGRKYPEERIIGTGVRDPYGRIRWNARPFRSYEDCPQYDHQQKQPVCDDIFIDPVRDERNPILMDSLLICRIVGLTIYLNTRLRILVDSL